MSKIEQQVMASVGVIHTFRRLTSITALKVYVLGVSFWGIIALIHVRAVGANFTNVAQNGVGDTAFFIVSAVLGTTLLVQLSLLFGIVALGSLVVDFVRSSRRAVI